LTSVLMTPTLEAAPAGVDVAAAEVVLDVARMLVKGHPEASSTWLTPYQMWIMNWISPV